MKEESKRCYVCKEDKPMKDFGKNRSRPDGLKSECRACKALQARKYNQDHHEERMEYKREWKEKNPERARKQYNDYVKRRLKTDLEFRIKKRLRRRLNVAMKKFLNGERAGSSVKDLGCTIEFFKGYIEALWQPGMSWDNYGRDSWHLDHIIPLASFDLTDREQFLKAFHYTNYQPLWKEDHMKKSVRDRALIELKKSKK